MRCQTSFRRHLSNPSRVPHSARELLVADSATRHWAEFPIRRAEARALSHRRVARRPGARPCTKQASIGSSAPRGAVPARQRYGDVPPCRTDDLPATRGLPTALAFADGALRDRRLASRATAHRLAHPTEARTSRAPDRGSRVTSRLIAPATTPRLQQESRTHPDRSSRPRA